MRRLGLDEAARDRGAPLEVTEFCSWRGRKLAEWPLTEIASGLDLFDVGIGRAELLEVLRGAIDESQVTAGAKLVGFEGESDAVTARFEGGREERGDVLVGADGLRSIVRATLLGAVEPDYAGYVQWQTLVDGIGHLLPSGVERITFAAGRQPSTASRLRQAALLGGAGSMGPPTRPARHLAGSRGCPVVRTVAVAHPRGDRGDPRGADRRAADLRSPAGRGLGRGRVTLLGDAAHPMTTNTSQGGNLAVEDGVVLAGELANVADAEAALRSYERRRIARTTPLVENSRWISNMNAWENPLRVAVRERMFSLFVPRKGLSNLRKVMASRCDARSRHRRRHRRADGGSALGGPASSQRLRACRRRAARSRSAARSTCGTTACADCSRASSGRRSPRSAAAPRSSRGPRCANRHGTLLTSVVARRTWRRRSARRPSESSGLRCTGRSLDGIPDGVLQLGRELTGFDRRRRRSGALRRRHTETGES